MTTKQAPGSNTNVNEKPKEPYSPPQVIRYGKVEDLTRADGVAGHSQLRDTF